MFGTEGPLLPGFRYVRQIHGLVRNVDKPFPLKGLDSPSISVASAQLPSRIYEEVS